METISINYLDNDHKDESRGIRILLRKNSFKYYFNSRYKTSLFARKNLSLFIAFCHIFKYNILTKLNSKFSSICTGIYSYTYVINCICFAYMFTDAISRNNSLQTTAYSCNSLKILNRSSGKFLLSVSYDCASADFF